jgi:peroxiredoxin
MKRLNIIILFLVLCITSFAQLNKFNYAINGFIEGLNNDSTILLIKTYDRQGILKVDTLYSIAKDNHFSFSGKSIAMRDASIRLGGVSARRSFSLFIEEGVISLKGKIDSLDHISVTGTPGNEEYMLKKKSESKLYGSITDLMAQIKGLGGNTDEVKKIETQINILRDSIKGGRIGFISTHKNSPASAIYLYVLQDQLTINQLENLYSGLSPQIKNLGYVKNIPAKINARKKSAIGNIAPEFTAIDISGKKFSLSDFRGSFVLLEFWASWCIPCRADNVHLKKLYDSYRDRGLVIIGISLDDKKEKWVKAIMEDNLPWIHTSELNAFENKLARLYGVQPIPDNFLLDPQGKIIARQVKGNVLDDIFKKEIK